MNVDRLLEHFERISDAADAVPRLRRFVLDLAVRGALVAACASDPPADVPDGVTRPPRSKAVDLPIESLPFTVPSTWRWAYLTEVADVLYGFAFASGRFNASRQGMPLIRIRDISSTDTATYFDGEYDDRYVVRKGDYLIGMDGDFNVRKWVGKESLLNQRVLRINKWHSQTDAAWCAIPLQMILDHIHGQTSQTTVKHLSAKQMNGVRIPLPPLGEQHRIVAKVDELMALCDRLEAAQGERETRRDRLVSASLARVTEPDSDNATSTATSARFHLDHFAHLTTRPEHVKQLRQTILNLAVRGRLVPHDGLWQRKTLSELCPLITSGSRGWAAFYAKSGSAFIRAQNIRFGLLRLDDLAYVAPPATAETQRCRLQKGDLLIVITGAGVTTPACVDRDLGEAYVSQHVALTRPADTKFSPWLLLCLMATQGCRSQLVERAYGAGKPGLNLDNIRTLEVPLPPLAEQRRIVAKVDELMALCDQLEASLASAATDRARLLEALLHEALAPAA